MKGALALVNGRLSTSNKAFPCIELWSGGTMVLQHCRFKSETRESVFLSWPLRVKEGTALSVVASSLDVYPGSKMALTYMGS